MISFGRRSKATLGIDVGSGFVKAVLMDHSGPEPVLKQAGYLPLVADAIVEGEVLDPGVVADTIRALIETLGADTRNVVTAIGGRDIIVKKIQMDRMPADDAREVIRWEAEQYVPFDMANVQLDFQILDPESDGLQMDVLLVAAKSELVDQRMALMRDAGVPATVVDVDAFAVHNAFEYNYPGSSRGLVGLLNVGHEISTVVVLQDGVPVVARDIPFGSRHLREDLRRMHSLSGEEADTVIHGQSPRVAEFAQIFNDRGQELVMGIERAIAFLATDSGAGRGLAAVYMSGGGAKIPRLGQIVADRLHAKVETANPLQRLKVDPAATMHFPADELASMLMLPVGLALRNLS
jgi:type IV pilus assembly protein PilM